MRVFMTLGEYGHTIDLSPVDDSETVQPLCQIASACITLRSSRELRALKDAILRCRTTASRWYGSSIT